ncbi:MAG: 2Fe-2S iron-sulfur cluster binding domain-containing protein [Armatimonadetes bacterium]|nr:2Fe-2S iron-sulfur cluster binding domain-containing protein [Armatimonadota bacterium]NIM24134.1 2Fe-2S iron-sulfur cluster binding domain-containing protein [Armatimonadota bacterium]NIM67990.1 2Fe-2S iron-sulfur cluster binding domain-containing protein [Armatimonadota bacterium]NIO95679.1 2Fe-2S iron-sulfur cluster binding domain-containing protein [Armatimonadota bacterium]NIT30123.1 2Fe-2S iron-sulfur cluster binding domain-containing protein [Armatimonadota bacterium]
MKKVLPVSLRVNGETYDLLIPPWRTLLEVLRENLSLTGAKRSCQEGQCGACTVLLEGKPINACLYLAVEAHDREILTVEGLSRGAGGLHPVQRSFVEKGAIQCGFCTPGLVLSVISFLRENPNPSEDEIRKAVVGHLCRCTGYVQIIEAILGASRELAVEVGR